MKKCLTAAAVLMLCLTVPCWAGSAVTIRLLQSSNPGDALKKTQPGAVQQVVATATVPLPAVNATRILGVYQVTCSGDQKNFSITVFQGGKQALRTTVGLEDGRPFILGGLQGGVLIFLAQ
jgi:hypothetical protein